VRERKSKNGWEKGRERERELGSGLDLEWPSSEGWDDPLNLFLRKIGKLEVNTKREREKERERKREREKEREREREREIENK
jgi:hypothetical protein